MKLYQTHHDSIVEWDVVLDGQLAHMVNNTVTYGLVVARDSTGIGQRRFDVVIRRHDGNHTLPEGWFITYKEAAKSVALRHRLIESEAKRIAEKWEIEASRGGE